jgi:hypothetical protein
LVLDLIVENIKLNDPFNISKEEIDELINLEKDNDYRLIQQALTFIESQARFYKSVTATIWITKGEHFLFSCSEEEADKDIGERDNFNKLC